MFNTKNDCYLNDPASQNESCDQVNQYTGGPTEKAFTITMNGLTSCKFHIDGGETSYFKLSGPLEDAFILYVNQNSEVTFLSSEFTDLKTNKITNAGTTNGTYVGIFINSQQSYQSSFTMTVYKPAPAP